MSLSCFRHLRALTVAALVVLPALLPRAAAAADCGLEFAPARAVARVLDSDTLALDDGSEVRLVGALGPRLLDSQGEDGTMWPPERDARAELEAITLGRSVELGFSRRRSDRHGRLLAHVFVAAGGGRLWVQERMLRSGHARAYALPENAACAGELLEHERVAREGKLGIWSNAAYEIRQAEQTRELLRYRGTFQVVEGRVRRVAEGRRQVFLEFGSDWRQDFTVRMRAGDRKAGTIDIGALAGRRVRVRGWIERRYGPSIDLAHASQIELLAD